MPLIRISLRAGKSAAYRTALSEGVYAALRETFDVPEDDRFVLIHEHGPGNFAYGAGYLGIARSDDLVIVQITCNDTRGLAQKRALYRAIADNLVRDPGLRPEDVFVSLVAVTAEDWSFGNGLAQYADRA